MSSPSTTGELQAHPLNPRSISEDALKKLDKSLNAFGDLGGITVNRVTRNQISGHQRCKVFGKEGKILPHKTYNEPLPDGTVLEGYIEFKGSRFAYREVVWSKEKEYTAMIAANAHGGEWVPSLLRENLELIGEDSSIDPDLVGLTPDFTQKLFRDSDMPMDLPASQKSKLEEESLENPMTAEKLTLLPSQVAMISLFFTVTSRPEFLEKCGKLQVISGKTSITDVVSWAIEEQIKAYTPNP